MPSTEEVSGGKPKPLTTKSPHILDLEDGLRYIVGTKVSIVEKNGKGRITIEFADNNQFENIVGKLNGMMKHTTDSPDKRATVPQGRTSPTVKKKR